MKTLYEKKTTNKKEENSLCQKFIQEKKKYKQLLTLNLIHHIYIYGRVVNKVGLYHVYI